MSGSVLTFTLLGDDVSASRSIARVGEAAEVTGTKTAAAAEKSKLSWGKVGGALVGGLALEEVFKTGLEAQGDYQKGLAQLTAGLKSTGGTAGLTAEEMEKLADNISGYSGQNRDGIVSTEQLLLTFKNIHDQAGKNNDIFTRTTKVAADMAARLGGDASAQAIKLGKALNDPIHGTATLTRVGVQFTTGQKALIKSLVDSGDTLGAQKVILDALDQKYAGSAKAAGDTLPGQINKAKNSFRELSSQLVADAAPALATFLKDADKIVVAISKHPAILKDAAKAVAIFAGAWAAMKIGSLINNLLAMSRAILGVGTASATAAAETETAGLGTAAAGEAGAARAAAGAGGLVGAQKLIVPIAVGYAITSATGLNKMISDELHGNFKQALADAPKWVNELANGVGSALKFFHLPAGNLPDFGKPLFGVLLSNKNIGQIEAVTSIYGKTAGHNFEAALAETGGNIELAWKKVYQGLHADPKFFAWNGTINGTAFGKAQQDAVTKYLTALSVQAHASASDAAAKFANGLSTQKALVSSKAQGLADAAHMALNSTLPKALADGNAAGQNFQVGINSKKQLTYNSGAGLADAASIALNTTLPAAGAAGSNSGASFWLGIASQGGNAAAAGAGLAAAAAAPMNFPAASMGASLGWQYAQGIASQAGAAAAAGASLAAAVASALPRSPAKKGPFAAPNDPESLGRKLTLGYARGVAGGAGAAGAAGVAMATAVAGGTRRPLDMVQLGGAGAYSAAAGGGDTHVHIHAWDGQSVDRWLQNGGAQKIQAATAKRSSRGGVGFRK